MKKLTISLALLFTLHTQIQTAEKAPDPAELLYLQMKKHFRKWLAFDLSNCPAWNPSPEVQIFDLVHEEDTEENALKLQTLLTRQPDLVNTEDGRHQSILQTACKYEHPRQVAVLLLMGARVHSFSGKGSICPGGWTALHYATASGNPESVKPLLDHGASATVPSKEEGLTPLHIATQIKKPTLIQLLLGHKNTPDDAPTLTDKKGWSSLLYAVAGGDVPTLQALLARAVTSKLFNVTHTESRLSHDDAKAFAAHVTPDGDTPLALATKLNQSAMISFLTEQGLV